MNKSLAFLVSLILLSLANSGTAQTLYWDGGTVNQSTNGDGFSNGGAGTWNTTLQNWDAGASTHIVWTSGADASFGAVGIASGAGTVTLGAPITANSLTVNTTNYIFTDGGTSANTLTVNSVTNAQATTISNNIVNTTGFTKAGSGTLVLLGTSAGLTGPLAVTAATLQLGNNSSPTSPTGFGAVGVSNNATFRLSPGTSQTYGQTISGGGAVLVQCASSGTNVTLQSSLGTASTFTGNVTVNQATLSFYMVSDTGGSDLGLGTNVNIATSSSATGLNYLGGDAGDTTTRTLTLGGSTPTTSLNANSIYGPLTWLGALALGTTNKHTLTLGGTSTLLNLFGGTIADGTVTNTAVTKSGAGTWMLAGTNTYSGGTTNSSGTLLSPSDAALGAATGPVTFTGSANLKSASNNVTLGSSRTVTVITNFTATFAVNDTSNFTVAAFITGAGNVTKGNSSFSLGTVRFSNDTNNFTGTFTAGYGNTEFTSVANSGTPSSLGLGITNGGAIVLGNVNSSGTLRYVGTNISATTRPLNWANTTGQGYALDASGTNPIAFLATNVLRSGAGGAVSLTLQGANAGTNTLAQVINDLSGVTTVTKSGGGTWVLGGTNTYSGLTSINNGVLSISLASNLGTGNTVLFNGNATLLGTAALTVPNTTTIIVTNAYAATYDNSAAAGSTFEIAAQIIGTGSVKRSSESAFTKGAIRFSNDGNDYTGSFSQGFGLTEFTSVANGGSPSALGAASSAYIIGNATSGATFRYVGATGTTTTRAIDWQGTTGALTLDNTGVGAVQFLAAGNLRSGAGAIGLTLQGTNTGANVLAQVINDSGGVTTVTKTGANTWTLTATNTYSGNTIISAGTLVLSGSGSIANSTNIIIATNSTLDVSGLSATFTLGATLGASQTLSNNTSTAAIVGNANTGTGSLALTYASGTPSLSIAGGTLTLTASTVAKVNNTGASLALGSYKLVAKGTGGAVAGTVPAVTVGGNGFAGGATASLSISNNELYLVIGSGTIYPPVISSFGLTGSAAVLNFSGTNGQTWKVLSSTNLTKALTNWDVVTTGTFAGAPVTYTNTTPVDPQRFYIITSP